MPLCCDPEKEADVVYCPVETTLKLIGGKYKTLIVWNLFDKTLRFSELQRAVPRATAKNSSALCSGTMSPTSGNCIRSCLSVSRRRMNSVLGKMLGL